MLKRKIYNELLNWKKDHKQKTLMINGARQVGKTFIIREFGKNEYSSFIEINFVKKPELKKIFGGDLEPETIYKNISLYLKNVTLIPHDTLIFLDEIQTCGAARTALKFLAEDGRYDVITSGSLLGLIYGQDDDPEVEEPESLPVGYEDFLIMYSLDFEEFLWALGYDDHRISLLKEYFDKNEKVPSFINNLFEGLFREFMVVGGMPEVVADFAIHKDFNRVAKIQKEILCEYEFDIVKHAKGNEKIKVKMCYDSIRNQLARELKRFQYSAVEKKQTSRKYGSSVQWLKDSLLVNACYNVREPYLSLLGNSIEEQFKLYINDTGLLCCMYGFDTKKALLNNTLIGNIKGGIYENAISESLIKRGYSLYYYKPDDEHEIEFLIEKDAGVVPIEVKSGNSATVSLNNYINNFNPKIAYKLINGSNGVVGVKKTIPHYMVMFL